MSEALYPEHDKINAVQNEYNTIREFLEWLGEHEMSFAEYRKSENSRSPQLVSLTSIESDGVIATFLGIDLDAIEEERRTMLDNL